MVKFKNCFSIHITKFDSWFFTLSLLCYHFFRFHFLLPFIFPKNVTHSLNVSTEFLGNFGQLCGETVLFTTFIGHTVFCTWSIVHQIIFRGIQGRKTPCLIVLEPVNDPFYDSSDKSCIFPPPPTLGGLAPVGRTIAAESCSHWRNSGGWAVIGQRGASGRKISSD